LIPRPNRQDFPVFSRGTGNRSTETGSPKTASTAKVSLFSAVFCDLQNPGHKWGHVIRAAWARS
jgi:hypothetical protein